MKKRLYIAAGLAAAAAVILLINPWLVFFIIKAAGLAEARHTGSLAGKPFVYTFPKQMHQYLLLFANLLPFIIGIGWIEIGYLMFRNKAGFAFRSVFMVFQLAIILYVLFSMFYIIAGALLQWNTGPEWQRFFMPLRFTKEAFYIHLLFMGMFTFMYTSYSMGRLRRMIENSD